MPSLTTLDRVADAASRFFMPELLATEDFDSFEASVSEQSRQIQVLGGITDAETSRTLVRTLTIPYRAHWALSC